MNSIMFLLEIAMWDFRFLIYATRYQSVHLLERGNTEKIGSLASLAVAYT